MREYPITVHAPNVYHINANTSNFYDDNQYQRKLSTINADNNYHQQHQQHQQQQTNFVSAHNNINNYNKISPNFVCTSNGDLSSSNRQSERLQNFRNNQKCNRSEKIIAKCQTDHFEITSDEQQQTNRNGSYSILNAITNAVQSGNCANTIYPINKCNGTDDIDQITSEADQLSDTKNAQSSSTSAAHNSNTSNGNQQEYQTYDIDSERPHQYPSATYKHSYLLWIGTPVAASFAVAIVIASLAGPQWLLTEEKIRNINYNGTINYNAMDDGAYVTKYTKSSLWILCFAQGVEYHCSKIDYFPKDEYIPDPNDSTMAIPYAVIKSTPFFLISGFILVVSYMVLMLAMCSQRHSVLFFFSGIFFIIAGLIMLIGIIMYISLFKSEIGSKLRPRSMFQTPLFTYRYGHSFILFVVGCISAEIVGTLNFFLFIRIREIGREKTIPCFVYGRALKEKCDEKRMRIIDVESKSPAKCKCQKHPTVPKAFFSPFTQRRYFFEKPTSKCDLHQKNLAKSLNELYTEPAPNTLCPFDLPHEFPLTRSVSTTTDIFSNCSGGFGPTTNNNSHKSLRTFTPQLNKRTTENQQMDCQLQSHNYKSISRDGSRDSLNSTGIVTKSILTNRTKSKDELFNDFCRRAGQRPKPKDIYFIDHSSYDNAAEKEVFVVENYATIRKNRRNSNMNIAQKATNIHNSNQSLTDSNGMVNMNMNNKQSYPLLNNLCDAERFGGSIERPGAFLNNSHDNYFSRSRNSSRDSNVYSSRTLPRDFLKRNFDYDANDYNSRRISANGLFTPYNLSMTLPAIASQIQTKPIVNETTDYYKKSYDTLASRNTRQRDAHTGSEDALSIHWPNAIPGSPANFSNRFNYTTQCSPNSQRKPALMSTFYSQHFPRPTLQQQQQQQQQQPPPNNLKMNVFTDDGHNGDPMSRFNDNGEYENVAQTNSNNNNAENENGSNSGGSEECATFDLDRMEKERRKSHASLFNIDIDFENGTPV